MLVASARFMVAVHDFENVVTAVSDVSYNIVQLRYAVFVFLGRRPLSRSHDPKTNISAKFDAFIRDVKV